MEKFTPENSWPTESIKPLYRGVWADFLHNNQELPLGGSVFGHELTTKLDLDFDSFTEQTKGFTQENLKDIYQQSEDSIKNWLQNIGSDIDPYTYFICSQIQRKTDQLLLVDPANPTKSSERQKMYYGKNIPKLSEMKGKTQCGERAALGQYLLQKIGAESAYVSGLAMEDIQDTDEYPEDHSFIVLKHPTNNNSSLIFDIARPHHQHHIPRVLETEVPFTYNLLKDKESLLVGATEVLQGGQLYYGVGEIVAGYHQTVIV